MTKGMYELCVLHGCRYAKQEIWFSSKWFIHFSRKYYCSLRPTEEKMENISFIFFSCRSLIKSCVESKCWHFQLHISVFLFWFRFFRVAFQFVCIIIAIAPVHDACCCWVTVAAWKIENPSMQCVNSVARVMHNAHPHALVHPAPGSLLTDNAFFAMRKIAFTLHG